MYSVAIIDDEKWIRKLIVKLLPINELPIRVIGEAEDGEAGLELAKKLRPDIIITDIRMPVLSGLEFIEKVRNLLPPVEIIIVSGYDNFEYAQRAIKFGVRDFLLKPVEETDLRNAVKNALQSIQAKDRTHSEKSTMERKLRRLEAERIQVGADEFEEIGNPKIRMALKYLHEHFAEALCLKNVCDHVAINPTYLSELFKKETGEGFNHYLVNLRLSKAQELLKENKNLSIADIAELVGFQDPNYFSRLFHKRMGITAQEYRDGKREK